MLSRETFTFDPRPNYPLRLTANRYWDPSVCTDDDDAVTLVFAHGTGFNKENWEPAISDLYTLASTSSGAGTESNRVKIRECWSIEAPNHGDSAALNAEALLIGYEPIFGWEEYARCLHLFLSGYGTGVPVDFSTRKLVAVGHSMGAVSFLLTRGYPPAARPYTFQSTIFVELMVMPPLYGRAAGNMLVSGAEKRRDTWPGKAAAYETLRARGTWKGWDDRVLRSFVETALKPVSAAQIEEGAAPGSVTLKCTKQQEAACYRDPLGSSRAYKMLGSYVKQVPTHLLYGAVDDYLPAEVKEDVINVVGGVQNLRSFQRVPKGGHLVPQQNPHGVAQAILTALVKDAEVASGSPDNGGLGRSKL